MRIEIWSLREDPMLTEPLEIFTVNRSLPVVPRIGDCIATTKMAAGRVEDVKWLLPSGTVKLYVR